MSVSRLDRILKNELCIGCGLCESIGKNAGYVMKLRENGFLYPVLPDTRDKEAEKIIVSACPAVNIDGTEGGDIWGCVTSTYYAHSRDPVVRSRASSGGFVSSLCIYLLESGLVDGILHVGAGADYRDNRLRISRDRESVIGNASSRYAPALVLSDILQILEGSTETYCFVGKPCDVQAVKKLLLRYPVHEGRIAYFAAIFCAGIPSFNATDDLVSRASKDEAPRSVQYRGDGWPGFFKATWNDGSEYRLSYNESWGEVLGRKCNFRCKICPDGIGLLADFSVGDAWETKDGYPDFSERQGRSFVIVRNAKADELMAAMAKSGAIEIQKFDRETICDMQPYQTERRLQSGYRLLAVNMLSGFIIRASRMNFLSLMLRLGFVKGFRVFMGTLMRSAARNKY
jgi:coenzyme F420 hydrogenase subunit beta